MAVPEHPKIYHIVHVDRLESIIKDGGLFADSELGDRARAGTVIGMNGIKARRLVELSLTSHPNLRVGQCVPFYFCPRSVMLYLIAQANHAELEYKGGQGPIIHLECSLHGAVMWANENRARWAFTLSNAGSRYFEDRADLGKLDEINWDAVNARQWRTVKEAKQAEFLLERFFPWKLVDRIGVHSQALHTRVRDALAATKVAHRPAVEIKPEWYY